MNFYSLKWKSISKRKVSLKHTTTHLVHKMTRIAMRNLHLMPRLHLILLLLVPLRLPVQTWQLLILLFLAFFRLWNMSSTKDSGSGSLAGKILVLKGTSNYHTWLESIQSFLMMLKVWCIADRTSKYPATGNDEVKNTWFNLDYQALGVIMLKKTFVPASQKHIILCLIPFPIPHWQILLNSTPHLDQLDNFIYLGKSWTSTWGGRCFG